MPSSGALFGTAASGPGSTGGIKHLIEMRAGKMNQKGRMVYPDKRKGLLYLYQSEDSLMHFCWQDRTTGIVEDDLIIFPDDCEYIKVPQCTTGRAYLLKFKSSSRRFFFWLQEPRADKDEDNCKRINEILNNPSSSVSGVGSSDQDLQSLLNNMSQSQLMQLFGGGVGQIGGLSSLLGTMNRPSAGATRNTNTTPALTHRTTSSVPAPGGQTGSTTASAPSTNTTPTTTAETTQPNNRTPQSTTDTAASISSPIQLTDLQNFLQGIAPTSADHQSVDLSTALTSDALSGLLSNSEAIQQLENHLPAIGGSTEEQLRSTLASPQFQQAVQQFSSALESGQLGPIVSQLSVNPEAVAAASQGNMADFVKALEKSNKESADQSSENKDAKKKSDKDAKKEDSKDDDEGMQLD
ncbi:hypothetical protein RN001_000621 [Aquatica leii]|uniref:Proteasomal ubiquitin receptor ADRM1 homolog n=1 Tax=Aquatica leii TaxID=1421715 RepID=A0AAN7PA95_9COLE|nr:hypothetical protein RN001_000621 [Aquatica leii]